MRGQGRQTEELSEAETEECLSPTEHKAPKEAWLDRC